MPFVLFRWRLTPVAFYFFLTVLAACVPYRPVLRAVKPQQVSVEPRVLEANGDDVPFTVTARVPARITKWEQKVLYKIELNYEYGEQSGKPLTEYVGAMQFSIGDYTYDPTDSRWLVATKAFVLPFAPAKHPGHLTARGYVTQVGKDPRRFRKAAPKSFDLAPGIITTARLVVLRPRLDFTPETYVPARDTAALELPIYFPPNMAVFNGQYGTNAAAMADFITDNVKTKSIRIVGGNAPDPVDAKNPRMAMLRARSAQKYIVDLLDKYGYQNSAASVKFSVSARPHDWSYFLERVENSALPEKQIDAILAIVNGPGSYERKAAQLEDLPCAEYLQTYVYPMMRRALVRIRHEPRTPRPDYELYLIAQRIASGTEDADALTEEELRYAASLTPLLEDKRRIYEGALKTGLSWPACHNLGLIYLKMSDQELTPRVRTVLLKKAVKNLTFAAHRNPLVAELWYHLAIGQQRLNNTLESLHAFDYAVKATGKAELMRQIFADKAALELIAGQPDDALASLEYAERTTQTVMNRGLANLLKGDYAAAAAAYEDALTMTPDDGGKLASYCRAIVAARAHDDNALSYWLTRAVALDATVPDRAVKDLEFRDYLTKDLFRDALKRL
jgi:tetratricopeptide (TPR) repeat protein